MGKMVPVMGSVILSLLFIVPLLTSATAGDGTSEYDSSGDICQFQDEDPDPIISNMGQWDSGMS